MTPKELSARHFLPPSIRGMLPSFSLAWAMPCGANGRSSSGCVCGVATAAGGGAERVSPRWQRRAAFAFVLTPAVMPAATPDESIQLREHLRRIAYEIQASRLLPEAADLPTAKNCPRCSG